MKLLKSLALASLVCMQAINAKAGNVHSRRATSPAHVVITPEILAEMLTTIMVMELLVEGRTIAIASVEELRSFVRAQRVRPCQHPFHLKLLPTFPADAKIDEEGEFKSIEVGSTVFNLPSNVASITFVAEEEVEA